jgi:hypothetical protein
VDTEVILDAAETEAPGLRELARRFLEDEAGHLGVPLDLASVASRRAGGEPEVHVTGAADRLLEHLAVQPDTLREHSELTALARAGVQALLSRLEAEKACQDTL